MLFLSMPNATTFSSLVDRAVKLFEKKVSVNFNLKLRHILFKLSDFNYYQQNAWLHVHDFVHAQQTYEYKFHQKFCTL